MTEMLSAPRFVYLWHRYLALGVGLLVVFGAAYFSSRSTAPAVFRLVILATPVLVTAALSWLNWSLRHVALADSFLEISRGASAVRVPVRDVERIVQTWSLNPSIVQLVLKESHPTLGRRVAFIPKEPTPFPPWIETELVMRLRRVCAGGASSAALDS